MAIYLSALFAPDKLRIRRRHVSLLTFALGNLGFAVMLKVALKVTPDEGGLPIEGGDATAR